MTSAAILLLLLLPASPLAAAGSVQPIEKAVARGAMDELRALRDQARQRLERRPTADDQYLLAYLNWRIQQPMEESERKAKDLLLKEAQKHLDQLLKSDPENAEALALRGSVIGGRITGMFGGMLLGPKASKTLRQAQEMAPDNPRVALLRGVGFYYTPDAFGGGMEAAEEQLRRAVELFDKEPPDKEWPNWGRVDALAWLGQIMADQWKLGEARSLYRRALEIEPDNAWIRDELLPALDFGELGE